MIRLIPVKSTINASEKAKKLKEQIYRNHRISENSISSRDPIFISKFFRSLFKSLGTKPARISAYHLQTDGQSEMASREVEEMFRGFVNYAKRYLGETYSEC